MNPATPPEVLAELSLLTGFQSMVELDNHISVKRRHLRTIIADASAAAKLLVEIEKLAAKAQRQSRLLRHEHSMASDAASNDLAYFAAELKTLLGAK